MEDHVDLFEVEYQVPGLEKPCHFKVMCWGEYGVVAPDVLTTNGSARMVAEHLRDLVLRGYPVSITPITFDPGDPKDFPELTRRLLEERTRIAAVSKERWLAKHR